MFYFGWISEKTQSNGRISGAIQDYTTITMKEFL